MSDKKDLPIYAIKLKRFRLSKGLNQKEFADLVGIAEISVSSYERGARRPKEKTMRIMADRTGLNIYEIFFNEELETLPCQK